MNATLILSLWYIVFQMVTFYYILKCDFEKRTNLSFLVIWLQTVNVVCAIFLFCLCIRIYT